MSETLTVITPTRDRPQAFELCERWMARQTRQPDQWIVVDSGKNHPARCTRGQTHIFHPPAATGSRDLAGKLIRALHEADGRVVAFIEDDDWYAPDYLETVTRHLTGRVAATGSRLQRHYNLQWRASREFRSPVGSCLCSTAFTRNVLGLALSAAKQAYAEDHYMTDRLFWQAIQRGRHAYNSYGVSKFVGIKGLPGVLGLGDGHRPDTRWHHDPEFKQLSRWIGPQDVQVYSKLPVRRITGQFPDSQASVQQRSMSNPRYMRSYRKRMPRYKAQI